jgi:hypothetical protein
LGWCKPGFESWVCTIKWCMRGLVGLISQKQAARAQFWPTKCRGPLHQVEETWVEFRECRLEGWRWLLGWYTVSASANCVLSGHVWTCPDSVLHFYTSFYGKSVFLMQGKGLGSLTLLLTFSFSFSHPFLFPTPKSPL